MTWLCKLLGHKEHYDPHMSVGNGKIFVCSRCHQVTKVELVSESWTEMWKKPFDYPERLG